jgi:hypothetical protein
MDIKEKVCEDAMCQAGPGYAPVMSFVNTAMNLQLA